MGGLLSKPKTKELPPPIEPPTVDEAAQARDQADNLRKRKGRAANILTGAEGDTGTKTTGSTKLLAGG